MANQTPSQQKKSDLQQGEAASKKSSVALRSDTFILGYRLGKVKSREVIPCDLFHRKNGANIGKTSCSPKEQQKKNA